MLVVLISSEREQSRARGGGHEIHYINFYKVIFIGQIILLGLFFEVSFFTSNCSKFGLLITLQSPEGALSSKALLMNGWCT